MKRLIFGGTLGMLAAVLLFSGCSETQSHRQGVYMLLDTSGNPHELAEARKLINYTLAKLNPGDSFAVARIDTDSFSEKDVLGRVTFDDLPSRANHQKRAFKAAIDKLADEVNPAAHTDITGGMLQAIKYLNEHHPGRKTVVIYSDFEEDVARDEVPDNAPLKLDGFDVVALDPASVHGHKVDADKYKARRAQWKNRVESGGGHWRVMSQLTRPNSH